MVSSAPRCLHLPEVFQPIFATFQKVANYNNNDTSKVIESVVVDEDLELFHTLIKTPSTRNTANLWSGCGPRQSWATLRFFYLTSDSTDTFYLCHRSCWPARPGRQLHWAACCPILWPHEHRWPPLAPFRLQLRCIECYSLVQSLPTRPNFYLWRGRPRSRSDRGKQRLRKCGFAGSLHPLRYPQGPTFSCLRRTRWHWLCCKAYWEPLRRDNSYG